MQTHQDIKNITTWILTSLAKNYPQTMHRYCKEHKIRYKNIVVSHRKPKKLLTIRFLGNAIISNIIKPHKLLRFKPSI